MTDTAAGREDCAAYDTWDGPYVLGALAREERREYEEHLAVCEHCRAAVAELAGLPGLLALVDNETAESVAAQESPSDLVPPERLLPRLAERAARERRRTRRYAIATAVAAAAAAVAIAVPVTTVAAHRDPVSIQQVVAEGPLRAQTATPVVATFKLLAVDGESRVDMWCKYPSSEYGYSWQLSLWVVRTDGTQSMLSQWTAEPGYEFTPDGTTSVPPDQLRAIEVRNGAGQVLLSATVGK